MVVTLQTGIAGFISGKSCTWWFLESEKSQCFFQAHSQKQIILWVLKFGCSRLHGFPALARGSCFCLKLIYMFPSWQTEVVKSCFLFPYMLVWFISSLKETKNVVSIQASIRTNSLTWPNWDLSIYVSMYTYPCAITHVLIF